MTGFENFIYTLGAITFATAVAVLLFATVYRIEHPRCRK